MLSMHNTFSGMDAAVVVVVVRCDAAELVVVSCQACSLVVAQQRIRHDFQMNNR
jgi:hypothetical protein